MIGQLRLWPVLLVISTVIGQSTVSVCDPLSISDWGYEPKISQAPFLPWRMVHPYPATCTPHLISPLATCITGLPAAPRLQDQQGLHRPAISCQGLLRARVIKGMSCMRVQVSTGSRDSDQTQYDLLCSSGGDNIQGRSDIRLPKSHGPRYGKTTPLNAT